MEVGLHVTQHLVAVPGKHMARTSLAVWNFQTLARYESQPAKTTMTPDELSTP